jgi:hypothetical protein
MVISEDDVTITKDVLDICLEHSTADLLARN